jgi:hypothetical protein
MISELMLPQLQQKDRIVPAFDTRTQKPSTLTPTQYFHAKQSNHTKRHYVHHQIYGASQLPTPTAHRGWAVVRTAEVLATHPTTGCVQFYVEGNDGQPSAIFVDYSPKTAHEERQARIAGQSARDGRWDQRQGEGHEGAMFGAGYRWNCVEGNMQKYKPRKRQKLISKDGRASSKTKKGRQGLVQKGDSGRTSCTQ